MSLTLFVLAVLAYYALHSILAAEGVKAKLYRMVPYRFYRLGYNVLSTLLLVALVYAYFLVEEKRLWPSNPIIPVAGAVIAIAGIFWVTGALKRYNLDEFIGLEQWRKGQKPVHGKLLIRGLNGKVRHPLYFGSLLIVWGAMLLLPTEAMFGFALISTIYLIIGSRLEEEKLVAQFGEAYRKYQREVPMLLPFRF